VKEEVEEALTAIENCLRMPTASGTRFFKPRPHLIPGKCSGYAPGLHTYAGCAASIELSMSLLFVVGL